LQGKQASDGGATEGGNPHLLSSVLATRNRHGVGTVLRRCCDGVGPLGIPWVALVHPLPIPSTAAGISRDRGCLHRAPGWFWQDWFGRYSRKPAFPCGFNSQRLVRDPFCPQTLDFRLWTLDLPSTPAAIRNAKPARLPPAVSAAHLSATVARKNIAPHIWTLVLSFWLRRRAAGKLGEIRLRAAGWACGAGRFAT
jgi:hypothetical protein